MKKVMMILLTVAGSFGLVAGQQSANPTQSTTPPTQEPQRTQQQSTQPQKEQSGMQQTDPTKRTEQQSMTSDANWEKIGESTIDPKKTREEVAINGKYKAIKIKSMESPVTLSDVEVEFESGDNQEVNLESTPIKARGESQVINLASGDRSLKKLHFGVKNSAELQGEKGKIEVWGLKADKK
jgi:cytoskeletal protein RodZ